MKFEDSGIIGIIVGAIGIGCAVFEALKADKVLSKLDTTMDMIDRNTTVEIREDIVEKAMLRAIDHKVTKAVDTSTILVREELKRDIHDQVSKAVERDRQEIDDKVIAKADNLIANMPDSDLKNKVIGVAAKKVTETADKEVKRLANDAAKQIAKGLEVYNTFDGALKTAFGNAGTSRTTNTNRSNRTFTINLDD